MNMKDISEHDTLLRFLSWTCSGFRKARAKERPHDTPRAQQQRRPFPVLVIGGNSMRKMAVVLSLHPDSGNEGRGPRATGVSFDKNMQGCHLG